MERRNAGTVEPIGFVLAGTGEIARRHGDAIARTAGCAVTGVLSRDPARARELARRYAARAFTAAEEIAACSDAGAMAIVTSNDRHVPLLRWCAANGRHAVVEKPLAIDVAEGAEAVAACRRAGLTVAGVFQRRFDPAVEEVRQLAEHGALGRAIGAAASLAWKRDAAYFDASPWRGDPERAGGGVLIMQAIHALDILRHLFGEVDRATGELACIRGHARVEDTVSANLAFASGARAALFATSAARKRMASHVALHFTGGSFRFEQDQLVARTDGGERAPSLVARAWRRLAGPRRDDRQHAFDPVYADFAAALREAREPRCTGEDALRSVALAEAIYRAAREGRAVAPAPVIPTRDARPAT